MQKQHIVIPKFVITNYQDADKIRQRALFCFDGEFENEFVIDDAVTPQIFDLNFYFTVRWGIYRKLLFAVGSPPDFFACIGGNYAGEVIDETPRFEVWNHEGETKVSLPKPLKIPLSAFSGACAPIDCRVRDLILKQNVIDQIALLRS